MTIKRIISSYIIKEFFRFFLLSISGLSSIYLIIEFIERIDKLMKNNLPFHFMIKFLAFRLPEIIVQMLPVAILMAILLSLGLMTKNGEILSLMASGLSLYQIVLPIVLCCVLICAVSILAQEKFLPFLSSQSQWYLSIIKGQRKARKAKEQNIWLLGKERRLYYLNLINPRENSIYGVTMFQMDDEFIPKMRIDAQKAVYENGVWHLYDGVVKEFTQDNIVTSSSFSEYTAYWEVTLNDLAERQKSPEQMGYSELRNHIKRLKSYGCDTKVHETDYQFKFSSSLSILIFALLGIPFAVRLERAVTFMGIGLSFGLSFIYWLIMHISISCAHTGKLPPLLGAWAGNIIFGALGIYLMVKMNSRC
ncbi:MAG: LPS export ABC transporter permease LptG [bacterium]